MEGLDFWIGQWALTWDGGHGTNTVTREMDGHVITERFQTVEPEPFGGLSVSVLGADGVWRQTWVDSTGSYWHFEGGPKDDGTFVFATPGRVDADQRYKRMVFFDIGAEGFKWRWEFSEEGSTWKQRRAITYRPA